MSTPLTRASEGSYIRAALRCVTFDAQSIKPEGDIEVAKVQGEGDYQSARRYNSKTRSFVKKAGAGATKRATGGVDGAALRKAKSKSRAGRQDVRDAELLRSLTARKTSKVKRSGTRARAR